MAESSRWGNTLKLWFDKGGYVIGLRASVASYNKTLGSLWTRVGTSSDSGLSCHCHQCLTLVLGNTSTYTTDIFFRDSTAACVSDTDADAYTKVL